MNYLFLKLLYDCKNIALANDDILLAVELDLGAGVLAGDDLLALLDQCKNCLCWIKTTWRRRNPQNLNKI